MRFSNPQTNRNLSSNTHVGIDVTAQQSCVTVSLQDDRALCSPRAVMGWVGAGGGLKDCEVNKLLSGERYAYKALAGDALDPCEVAVLAQDRKARVNFFSALESCQNKGNACAALHSIIATDGPESYWFLRKNAFEYLRRWSSAPLSASMTALVSTPDCSLRARVLKEIIKDLSFPLSSPVRQEIDSIRSLGGELCNQLLVSAPSTGVRPTWVSDFPQFVRAWILACAAIGVDHGVSLVALRAFSRDAGGPLNDWHIRRALEPLDPLSWGGMQAMIRRVARH